MTDPVASMLEAQEPIGNATWLLLHQEKWAPTILATLSTVFDQGSTRVHNLDAAGEIHQRSPKMDDG